MRGSFYLRHHLWVYESTDTGIYSLHFFVHIVHRDQNDALDELWHILKGLITGRVVWKHFSSLSCNTVSCVGSYVCRWLVLLNGYIESIVLAPQIVEMCLLQHPDTNVPTCITLYSIWSLYNNKKFARIRRSVWKISNGFQKEMKLNEAHRDCTIVIHNNKWMLHILGELVEFVTVKIEWKYSNVRACMHLGMWGSTIEWAKEQKRKL